MKRRSALLIAVLLAQSLSTATGAVGLADPASRIDVISTNAVAAPRRDSGPKLAGHADDRSLLMHAIDWATSRLHELASGTGTPSVEGDGSLIVVPSLYDQPTPDLHCAVRTWTDGADRQPARPGVVTDAGANFTPLYVCSTSGDDSAETAEERVIVVTAEELQSLPIESGGLVVQPDQAWVLVNIDTVVYTGAREEVFDIVLLGVPVRVEVVPVEFAWDFGDGSPVVTGTDPGAPWPEYTVGHTYTRAGTVQISLTTQWAGRFQIAGSAHWLPVVGRAVTQEVSEPIEVVTATPRLIAPGS